MLFSSRNDTAPGLAPRSRNNFVSVGILEAYLKALLLVVVLFSVPVFYYSVDKVITFLGIFGALFLSATCLYFLRHNRVWLAANMVIWGSWGLVSFLVYRSGGVKSMDCLFYIPTVVAAGLVFGTRIAFLISVASITWLSLLLFFAAYLPVAQATFPGQVLILFYCILFLLIIIPLRITIHSLRGSIDKAYNEVQHRMDAEQTLRDKEAELLAVVEAIHGGVFLLDPGSGQILRTNRNATPLLGYSEGELYQMSLLRIMGTHSGRVALLMQQAAVEEPQSIKLEVQQKSGSRVWVEMDLSRTTVGGETRVLLIMRDVSKELELERRLVESQKMEAIGTLAGGVAHDFNNILCSIIGFTELARMDSEGDKSMLEKLDQVLQSSVRARDLVAQILTFGRRNPVQAQPISLAYVLRDAMKLLRPAIPASIEIRLDIQDDLPAIMADGTQLHQVVMNLVSNSAHALEGRTPALLSLACRLQDAPNQLHVDYPQLQPGKTAMLEVRDTGHGMSQELIARIFEPFFTTKKQGDGTGLGLSVVHGIVRSYNGAVHVSSTLGEGTVFQLYFPVINELAVPLESPEEAHFEGNHERVLFVDDEPVLCSYMEKLLLHFGVDPVVENSAEQALVRIRSGERFDLVISDLTMPVINGIQLADTLRATDQSTPFVLASGHVHEELKPQLKRLGVHSIMPKPYNTAAVAQVLSRALRPEQGSPTS